MLFSGTKGLSFFSSSSKQVEHSESGSIDRAEEMSEEEPGVGRLFT